MYDLGQPVEVVDMAIPYYKMLVFSMPFVMLFFAFKQFLEGVGNTKVEMVVTIIANMANIGFNAVFIYGRFGLPKWVPRVPGWVRCSRASSPRS